MLNSDRQPMFKEQGVMIMCHAARMQDSLQVHRFVPFVGSPHSQFVGDPACEGYQRVGAAWHDAGGNAGLENEMWATVVNRDGTVCAVARSSRLGDQWPGSRVISAQKANTHSFLPPGYRWSLWMLTTAVSRSLRVRIGLG